MSWFKVDDNLCSHPKARTAGLAAMGLWAVSGAYSAQYLTEGWVPKWFVLGWPSGLKLASKLVTAGLWDAGDDGWLFHQWEERNPSKRQVEETRAATRDRQQRWRETSRDVQRDKPVSNAVTNAVSNDAPTRPVPKRLSSAMPPREDVELLCKRLHDRISGNGSKAEITTPWRNAARLMLDRDGRDFDKAMRLIDWCQDDPFWNSNILSMPTFRAKYDQLRLRANSESATRSTVKLDVAPGSLPIER